MPYAAVSARTALVGGRRVVLGFVGLISRLRPPRAPRVAVLILVAALIAAVGVFVRRFFVARPNGLRIAFLDVGQGDGVLLQAPGGAVLVDEGCRRRTSQGSCERWA